MQPTAPTTELDGRSQVRLRLRPNLERTRHEEAGQAYYVVKDPISLAYFRMDESQYFLASRMDGKQTLAQLRTAYEEQFRPARLSLEELEDFARQLLEAGLAETDAPLAGSQLYERAARQRQGAFWARIGNPLCIRLPLFDPNRVLDRLLPVGRALFSLGGALAAGTAMVAALVLVATHWQECQRRLPEARDFFSFQTLLYFWVALGVVKVLHELGHGLCCKVQGGVVHEIGVLVLCFFPTLYCNVSDSWSLSGKWRRIAVGAAGMYVELIVASLAAFVWYLADPATIAHRFAFALMVVCSVNTLLCNGNPLLRFDGYFILADLLGIPNLGEVSSQCLQTGVLRWLGVPVAPVVVSGGFRTRWLGLYALASHVYRCVMLCTVLYFVCGFLQDQRLSALGNFLVLSSGVGMLAWPVGRFVRSLKVRGRLPELNQARLWLVLGGAAVVLLGFFALPLPVKVRGLALLQAEPSQASRVVVPDVGGFLQEILVRDGQEVQAGEILAVLDNPKLRIKLQLADTELGLRVQQQGAQVDRLAEPASNEEMDLEAWQRNEVEVRALTRQQAALREQAARLVLRAPCAGTVLGLRPVEDRGKWLDKGAEVCSVANAEALRALVLVEPADRKLIVPGATAAIRVHGGGNGVSHGIVKSAALLAAQNVPPQLSHHAGGDVPTYQDAVSKAETPQRQHFVVTLELRERNTQVHPGILGRVRIDAGSQTLYWRCKRYLATTFNWGL